MVVSAERVVKANAGPKVFTHRPCAFRQGPWCWGADGWTHVSVGSHLTGNSAPQIPMMAHK